ncbi:MAG: DUF2807 domain-containing protein [Cyclobacteriaceae bacterium]|nr:DUF2807 domain-containing protein [Cyclobacteriaceae bacterium]MDX5465823.1 DUF2807 domain-containing protein [Cyclobacteriaceae bacterium]
MNPRKIFFVAFLLLTGSILAFAQKTETRTPGSFTQIENSGSWDIHIQKGSKDEVRLESKSFDLSKVITVVEGDKLKIKLEKGNWKNVDLTVYVTVRELESVGNGGSGDMYLESDFGAESFNIGLSGSGSITTKSINAGKLNVGMSGSGKVFIAGGQAEKAHIGQSGSGDLEALDFVADAVDIGKSGSGNTSIGVSNSLTVGSSGSGNIYYRGNPEKQSIGVSGSSRVIKK